MLRPVIGVGLVLLTGLASITFQQSLRWQSNQTLWCAAADRYPARPRPLINCAAALLQVGEYDRADALLERASVEIEDVRRPRHRYAWDWSSLQLNRAMVRIALHRPDDARAVFATVTDPRFRDSVRYEWLR